ncbi:MAG: SEC-C domain-containing protein [Clostridiales Family XIII bacterium]|jgi:hypothetical protein|nr:SEC-C domain-containing protein [Clostridiales Family XIII bacterium]
MKARQNGGPAAPGAKSQPGPSVGLGGPGTFARLIENLDSMSEEEMAEALSSPEILFSYLVFQRKPMFDLRSLFGSFSLKELREQASQFEIKGRSRMDKAGLIDAMYECYMHADLLPYVMANADERDMVALDRIMNADVYYVEDADFPYEFALMLLFFNLITGFCQDGRVAIIAPREVREKYEEALDILIGLLRETMEELDDMACAAANLYGVIPVSDFMGIYSGWTDSDFGEAEVRKFLSDIPKDVEETQIDYRLRGNFIANEALEDWSMKDLQALHRMDARFPRKLPSKEDFLKYADWSYFERTPSHMRLLAFVAERMGPDAEEGVSPEDVIGEVSFAIRSMTPTEECLEILESFGVEMKSDEEIEQAVFLISDVHNDTRLWGNNGSTPKELSVSKVINVPFSMGGKKIGRNDPCPCGSGRKYKSCCGKPTVG